MKHRWIWYVLAALNAALLAFYVWGIAEDIVPLHYGITGLPDRFGSKWWLLFPAALPLILLLCYQLYCRLTRGNPRIMQNRRYENKSVPVIALAFVPIAWLVALFRGERLNIQIACWLSIVLGLLMMYLSNYMGKIQPNRTFGYRLPWTLKDDEVWRRTHRMAAYWGVVGGAMMLLGGGLGFALGIAWPIAMFILGMLAMLVVPGVFAYRLYHRLHP